MYLQGLFLPLRTNWAWLAMTWDYYLNETMRFNLLTSKFLLCLFPLHILYLISVPTQDILLPFGFSWLSIFLSFLGLPRTFTYFSLTSFNLVPYSCKSSSTWHILLLLTALRTSFWWSKTNTQSATRPTSTSLKNNWHNSYWLFASLPRHPITLHSLHLKKTTI